jgi:hypothetical protein
LQYYRAWLTSFFSSVCIHARTLSAMCGGRKTRVRIECELSVREGGDLNQRYGGNCA